MDNKICIATGNLNKLHEMQVILDSFKVNYCSKNDFNIKSPPETGLTFVENAIIKARHSAKISNLPTIADDSGLCIDVLNQSPGVNSARYAGENATLAENIQKIILDIEPYKQQVVTARLITVICFMVHAEEPNPILITEVLHGELLHEPRGETRGYDALFYLPELKKTLGELSIKEKNQISPRGKGTIKLMRYLE